MLVPKLKLITVTTAGTRVPVFAATDVQPGVVTGVVIAPNSGNTGSCYVGDVTVAAANGIEILKTAPPFALPIGADGVDLQKVYCDAATNGDKVKVLYFEKVSR